MAIESMKKVAVFGLSDEFPNIAHGLQRLSMLHISNIETLDNVEHDDGGEALTTAENNLLKVEAALEALKPYNQNKRGALSAKPQLTESQLCVVDSGQNWQTVEQTLALSQKLPAFKSQRLQLHNALEALMPYEKLAIDISDIHATQHTFMTIGTVPETQYQLLLSESLTVDAVVESIGTKKDLRTVFVAAHKEQTEEVLTVLRAAGFVDANLSVSGTIRLEQERLRREIKQTDEQTQHIESSLKELSQKVPELQTLYDCCSVAKQRAALALESGRTGRTFYLTGWVRERQADKLALQLHSLSDAIAVEFPQPNEGEIPPTAMQNSKLLKPFESITEMYSAPSPYEADPTFMMAPFFLCFFGMMVSDAAYGIILTVVSLLILKKTKAKGMMGQILSVVAIGGIATLIWGVILGSWFGEALLPSLWFNPLKEPIKMLLLCLGLGLIHISFGVFMKAWALIKQRKFLAVIFDCGFVLCVLWGAVAAFVGVSFGLNIVLVGVIGMLLTAGRDRKGIAKKFIGGFSAVYGLSSYLSDVLSYSRLFGMGIATGVIAMVFNTIAGMLMGGILGTILGVVVLVIGHTFNIAINALGAFVHASRLQYIEFYNKFYEGGGRVFAPYTFKTKYTQLILG